MKVEVDDNWNWRIWRWNLKLKQLWLMKFEVKDIWSWRNLRLLKIEDDEIWSRRKLKSKSLKVIKFEIEVWSWSVKLKFESWRNYGWRKLKLINLKLKKLEGNEIWTWWYLKLDTVKDIWSHLDYWKLKMMKYEAEEIWNSKLKKIWNWRNSRVKKVEMGEN